MRTQIKILQRPHQRHGPVIDHAKLAWKAL